MITFFEIPKTIDFITQGLDRHESGLVRHWLDHFMLSNSIVLGPWVKQMALKKIIKVLFKLIEEVNWGIENIFSRNIAF